MYSKIYSLSYFPKDWRKANVVLLRKPNRDPTNATSYRPICLLNAFGKIYEKILKNKIMHYLNKKQILDNRQFGFTKGLSTEHAVNYVVSKIKNHLSNNKHVLTIGVDIKGAFDNCWHPALYHDLKTILSEDNRLLNILYHYLNERKITLQMGNEIVVKNTDMGCPQGSVLGPLLWNILFNGAIKMQYNEKVDLCAYADDLLFIITGDTKVELERLGNDTITKLGHWLEDVRLKLSVEKCYVSLFTKSLKLKRKNIKVRYKGSELRVVQHFKYLGIHIDNKLSFNLHINEITSKMDVKFCQLLRACKNTWGFDYNYRIILYKSLVENTLSYCCSSFIQRIQLKVLIKKLYSTQRKFLVNACRAYKTTSHSAAVALTGVLPIDLLMESRAIVFALKNQNTFPYVNQYVIERMSNLPELNTRASVAWNKMIVKKHYFAVWQKKWEQDTVGRHTFSIIPNVTERHKLKLMPDFYVTQLLTGHGSIAEYLFRFKLKTADKCLCGATETTPHLIFDCPLHENIRNFNKHDFNLINKTCAKDFQIFAFKVMHPRFSRPSAVTQ